MKKYQILSDAYQPTTVRELLLYMIRPYRLRFIGFFALSFAGVFCWNASSYVASNLITNLTDTVSVTNSAWRLVIIFGFLRLFDEIFWRIAELLMRSFKPQMIERIRAMAFKETLQKPHTFFTNSSSGRIAHWINKLADSTDRVVDNTIWGAWGEFLGLVLSAFFLLTVHWSLALIFSVWLFLLFWYNIRRGREFSRLVERQSDETSKASGLVVDVISNNSSFRVFNAREHERANLDYRQQKIISSWRKSWRYNLVTNTVKGQSTGLVNVFALSIAVILFSNDVVSIGGLVLFLAYFNSASSSLWNLTWNLDEYYRLFGTMQNSLDGLHGEDERRGELTKNEDVFREVSVELKNLSFAYPEMPQEKVLKKISLRIEAGQKVGVVGHSGAGKSTLIGLLLGFYVPSEGSITINEIDVMSKDPSFVRTVSAYVPQDTSMFNRTIRENVLYARPDATEKELMDALEKAKAREFVEKLSKGVDTLVGERGVKLSGGQRQRIAIARAILKDAPLLLLDEATSALDSVSEQAIQKALYELMKGRTAVVIAHRLSTLKHLDKIVVVEKGKIVEEGTHDELLRIKDGIYADLWKRQKDGFIVE